MVSDHTKAASGRTAVVTGASSGIGAATVRALARAGFETVAAARRLDRCEALAREVGGRAVPLDVADSDSVRALAEAVPDASVVVHSAGGALGLAPVSDADEAQWLQMYETNVLGVMRVTKALLPALERSGDGHIVVIGSVAGVEVYPGGGGYTAAKHAANALVANAAPGAAGTAHPGHRGCARAGRDGVLAGALRRRRRASAEGLQGAGAPHRRRRRRGDRFAVTRPPRVNVDYIAIKPTAQATATVTHRDDG